MEPTVIGAYGEWAARRTDAALPALSFRRDQYQDLDAWRTLARRRVLGRVAPPPIPAPAAVETLDRLEYDGLHVELLRWPMPCGAPTEAVLLRPLGATGALPGVLALHGHGGEKYFGKAKIARWGAAHPLAMDGMAHAYGGRAWANELARLGYVVLVRDAFGFGSRRVRVADLPAPMRPLPADPDDDDHDAIAAYNAWARGHESILAQALLVAGTTWAGASLAEDQLALQVLADRPDVDAARLGCGGLSGGGCRTVFLAGLDPRVRCAVCAGFMTTWRGFMLDVHRLRSWMAVTPGLSSELDFPEILALRAPAATMVLNSRGDPLWSMDSMQSAESILADVFAKAGRPDRLRVSYYDGGHRFDVPMQQEAFDWFDRWLAVSE